MDPSQTREGEQPPSSGDAALVRLRKADVWTGLVLAIIAAAMVAEALTFPLQGTYAGVRNVWYVSPALFPLIVGVALFALSAGLFVKALRDYRQLVPRGRALWRLPAAITSHASDAVLIAFLLAAYIVGLVPRVDFVVSTALFLLVFMGVYGIASVPGRFLLVLGLGGCAAACLALALAGGWPAPRSAGQSNADAIVGALTLVVVAVLIAFARGEERRRLVPIIASALGTALVLSLVFKYGLLVPLPREGLGVLMLDRVMSALTSPFG